MRNLIKLLIIGVLLIVNTILLAAQEVAPFPTAPGNISSVATLVSDNEPGERLIITGIVYKSDRKTPMPHFILYFYQTDATGVYNHSDRSWMRPRIHGWVKTDKSGRYEIRTIKPGSYPGSRNPAHIHVIVALPGKQPNWIDDFLFEHDPYLSEPDRKRSLKDNFSHIMKSTKENDGMLRATRNIKLNVD